MIGMDALHKVIDATQLTHDMEGTLHYDHSVWIELRCVSDAFATSFTPTQNRMRYLLVCSLLGKLHTLFVAG